MLKKDRLRRKKRIVAKIFGKTTLPRLSIYRSNKYIYAQIIEDLKGKTLAAAYGDKAETVGEEIAKKAKSGKITKVVFDRGGYRYHGRIKSLAEAARKGGLVF